MMVQNVPVEELVPYELNPRKNNNVDEVAASIRAFGFRVPLVVRFSDKVIVCGHSRYYAAKSLGLKNVPCINADDMTDEQIEAFRLVENKTGELAGWDFEKLDEELAELKNMDMTQFGFNPAKEFEHIGFDSGEAQHREYKCPCCGEWFSE